MTNINIVYVLLLVLTSFSCSRNSSNDLDKARLNKDFMPSDTFLIVKEGDYSDDTVVYKLNLAFRDYPYRQYFPTLLRITFDFNSAPLDPKQNIDNEYIENIISNQSMDKGEVLHYLYKAKHDTSVEFVYCIIENGGGFVHSLSEDFSFLIPNLPYQIEVRDDIEWSYYDEKIGYIK